MLNYFISFVASLLLLLGLASMLTPIPGGTLLIAGSLTTLICTSPMAQACLRVGRTHLALFDKVMYWLEEKVGTKVSVVGVALKKTRPITKN